MLTLSEIGTTDIKDDLEYVYIEAINKEDKNRTGVISGIFKGIKYVNPEIENDNELFIIEVERNKVVYCKDTTHKILCLEYGTKEYRDYYYFMDTDIDQGIARKMLKIVIEALKLFGKVTGNIDADFVDTSKYTNIPSHSEGSKEGTVATSKPTSPNGIIYGPNKAKETSFVTYTTMATIKKDPVPTYFKRSRKPTAEILGQMRKAVLSIKDGKYIPPELPKVKNDNPSDGKTTTSWPVEDDTEYLENGAYLAGYDYSSVVNKLYKTAEKKVPRIPINEKPEKVLA